MARDKPPRTRPESIQGTVDTGATTSVMSADTRGKRVQVSQLSLQLHPEVWRTRISSLPRSVPAKQGRVRGPKRSAPSRRSHPYRPFKFRKYRPEWILVENARLALKDGPPDEKGMEDKKVDNGDTSSDEDDAVRVACKRGPRTPPHE